MSRSTLLAKAALLPAALLLALCGATVASAQAPLEPAPSTYTIQLSPAAATVPAGAAVRTVVSLRSDGDLDGELANGIVTDLPTAVTARFTPAVLAIGGDAVLTLVTSPSTLPGTYSLTVAALTIVPSTAATGGDPIGVSTTFTLTVTAP